MPKHEEENDENERSCCYWVDCLHDFWRSPVGRHLVNARKELLLAMRASIDRRIDRLEKLLEDDEAKRVPVE